MSRPVAAARTMRAHGLSIRVPTGWDGSISRAAGDSHDLPADLVGREGTANPVLHVASFSLPTVRGDYGGGAVERMGPHDVFIALVEFDPQARSTPLFGAEGLPTSLQPAMFHRSTMHRPLPGASGHQRFFHAADRAFALYVALGAHRLRARLVPRVDRVVSTLRIDRR